MKHTFIALLALCLCLIGFGCATGSSAGSGASYIMPIEIKTWSTPKGKTLTATVGTVIYEESHSTVPSSIKMTGSIKSSIPGALDLPFTFEIKECELSYIGGNNGVAWYKAPEDMAFASHGLLGNVIVAGDDVGVALSVNGGQTRWYVDNSIWNNMRKGTTVWTRRVTVEDGVELTPLYTKSVADNSRITRISYDGKLGNSFRFSSEEITARKETTKEYFFEISKSAPTQIAIKNTRLEILGHTGTSIKYRVKQAGESTTSKPNNITRSIQGSATGFFISEDGYILTNHHVVDKAKLVTVRIGKKNFPAKIIKVDPLNDLAVLKVEGKFSALPVISSRKVGLGEEVLTIGFPQVGVQGYSPKLTKGIINSLSGVKDDPRNFQISVPLQPGNSGGPLVDQYGNVVGVVVSRLSALKLLRETGALPQNVNYAVKGSYATAFLEALPNVANKLKEPNPSTKPRKFPDVVREVQAATVLILVR